MKSEIRERIDCIRRSGIPNGYLRTRAGIMPEDWINKEPYIAGSIFRNHSDKNHEGDFEVLSATQDRGIIPRKDVEIDIKYAEDSISGYKKVDYGDFVISLRSFQGGIEYSEYEGLVSPAYTVLKSARPIENGYYKQYFKTGDFISRLNSAVYGIRDGKQIGYEDFSKLVLHYPSMSEQQKISEILTNCDKVIELKKQLINEKLRQRNWLMRSLLNPDNHIRLPEFRGEWQNHKLGEICETFSGGTPNRSNSKYYGGEINWLKSGELNARYILNTEEKITHLGLKNSSAKIVPAGTILLALYGATAGVIAITKIDTAINQAILAITPVYQINTLFLMVSLENQMQIAIGKYTQGGQPNFNAGIIKKLEISIPDIEEQNAIAKVFSSADCEIELLEQELLQWQAKKRSLQQLLLTGIVRV